MLRSSLLVVCCAVLLGTSCPGGVVLTCANNPLDGSEVGFTVVIPPEFVCQTVSPIQLANVVAAASYVQESTGISVSVTVDAPEAAGAPLPGVTDEDLGTVTVNGIDFAMRKLTIDLAVVLNAPTLGQQFSYGAGTTLPSGNNLVISVSAETDLAALATTLDTIKATVAIVGS